MTHETEEITTAVMAARDKDEQACQKILNLYKGRIFSYVYRLVRNYHDAEDITSEIFIRCFQALDSFDVTRRFSTWLFTIAHNKTMDFFRRSKQEYEYLDERHAVADDFVKEYEKKKKLEKIEACIAQLPPLDRELVVLFHKEEHTYQEISEITGLPITTIKTRLHRARKKLQKLVAET